MATEASEFYQLTQAVGQVLASGTVVKAVQYHGARDEAEALFQSYSYGVATHTLRGTGEILISVHLPDGRVSTIWPTDWVVTRLATAEGGSCQFEVIPDALFKRITSGSRGTVEKVEKDHIVVRIDRPEETNMQMYADLGV